MEKVNEIKLNLQYQIDTIINAKKHIAEVEHWDFSKILENCAYWYTIVMDLEDYFWNTATDETLLKINKDLEQDSNTINDYVRDLYDMDYYDYEVLCDYFFEKYNSED